MPPGTAGPTLDRPFDLAGLQHLNAAAISVQDVAGLRVDALVVDDVQAGAKSR